MTITDTTARLRLPIGRTTAGPAAALELDATDAVLIIGAAGTGKTTLANRIATGLRGPDTPFSFLTPHRDGRWRLETPHFMADLPAEQAMKWVADLADQLDYEEYKDGPQTLIIDGLPLEDDAELREHADTLLNHGRSAGLRVVLCTSPDVPEEEIQSWEEISSYVIALDPFGATGQHTNWWGVEPAGELAASVPAGTLPTGPGAFIVFDYNEIDAHGVVTP